MEEVQTSESIECETSELAYCRSVEPTRCDSDNPTGCSVREELVVRVKAMTGDASDTTEETDIHGCEADLHMEPLVALNRLALNISDCYAQSNML